MELIIAHKKVFPIVKQKITKIYNFTNLEEKTPSAPFDSLKYWTFGQKLLLEVIFYVIQYQCFSVFSIFF